MPDPHDATTTPSPDPGADVAEPIPEADSDETAEAWVEGEPMDGQAPTG
jgi:hypothetical protein